MLPKSLKIKLDQDTAANFQRRFSKMIVGRDKESGRFVVLFRSENDFVVQIKTNQKEPEDLERKKDL